MIIACLAGSLQVFRCVIVCKPKALLACDGLRSSFHLTGLEDLEMENITVSISCFACKPPELRKFCFSNVNEEKYIFDLFLHECNGTLDNVPLEQTNRGSLILESQTFFFNWN